ncbi:MAG: adenylate/guanylate cyclase domain-containing protein [Pseudomonadota bacterium]
MPGMDIDPTLTEPHLSNRFLAPFFDLLEERHGADFARQVSEDAGLPLEHLRDPGRWVSLTFMERLTALLVERITGRAEAPGLDDPLWQLWRDAGQRSMDRRYLGPLYYAIRALGTPQLVYKQMADLSGRANQVTRMSLVSRRARRAVIRVEMTGEEFKDSAAFCWNRVGAFESIPCVWGLPRATVRQLCCMHDPAHPADACEYEIHFEEPRFAGLRRSLLSGVVGAGVGVAVGSTLGLAPATLFPGVAALGFAILSADLLRLHLGERRLRAEDVLRLNATMTEFDQRYDNMWREQVALRRSLLVNRKIAEYLAADVVEEIVRDPEKELALGGVLKDAAVMFVDIVGFTARCERLAPEVVVDELNTFFAHADQEVQKTGGIVDKRIGDGMMVVFVAQGTEECPGDIRRRAAACSLAMLRALRACNAELASRGAAPLRIRVGIAAGPLVQGNMGSEVKLEYTVIGDAVNLASRLESLAEPGNILMERSVWEAARAFLGEAAERHLTVKGKSEEVVAMMVRLPEDAPQ